MRAGIESVFKDKEIFQVVMHHDEIANDVDKNKTRRQQRAYDQDFSELFASHSNRRPLRGALPLLRRVKTRLCDVAVAHVDVSREGEEREILTVHVVLEVEDA